MKRILLLFLLALPCIAQITGNITASGSTCATTNACVSQQLSASAASAGVTISGTWSATLQFEVSNDNGATWAAVNATPPNSTTAVTSTTANGTWRINVAGMTNVHVRASALASGTAQVTITFGSGSASSGGGGGAGTPGGSNTQIQYNNAGAFGGDSGCTTNGTGTLTCTSFLGALTGNVTGNVSGSSGSTTGNAATATAVNNADDTTTNATVYPLWTATAGGNFAAKVSTTKFSLNPSTGLVTATGFSGALTGNVTGNVTGSAGSATTATTATNATNVATAADATNSTYSLAVLPTTTGNQAVKTVSGLTVNPSTGAMAIPGAVTIGGSTAGFFDFPQGTTSAAVAPCNVANSICEQAPTSVTSYLLNLPGAAANGIRRWANSANVVTESVSELSGDASTSGSNAVTVSRVNGIGIQRVTMTADWTCGNSGTSSTCTAAVIVGTNGTPLTITLPSVAASYHWQCDGVVGQATAATANSWNVITATNAPTNLEATYLQQTAATAFTGGALTGTSATTTSVIGPAWTLGGTGTKMPFHVQGSIEGASASGTVVSLQLVAPTTADVVTVYRGATCSVTPF